MKHVSGGRFSRLVSNRKTGATLVALFLTCLFILSACGGSNPAPNTTSSPSKKGGTLNVGLIAEPTTMDNLKSVTLYDTDVMQNMYDTLLKYDDKGKIQPELVSSYDYASPTVLNLTLRSGIKFHDGTPFNADAVVFNLNRFISDKTSPRYTDVENIDTVTKVSDTQVQIKLKKSFSPLLNVLTGDVGMMLSPTAVKSLGSKLANTPTNAGSGPFMFVEWIKGDHLLLKANPNYWKKDAQGNPLPYLQNIRFRTITNATVMYNNLETAQIQVATSIDPNNVAQIKSDPNLTYRQIPTPGFSSLQLNLSQPPLDNLHVRRAIALGINRQEILDHVLKGVGVVAHGPLSPASWAYDQNFKGLDFDLNQAKAELAQSGLSKVAFTLLYTSGNPTTDQEVQFIQSQLQAVGITVSLKQETFTTVVSDFQTFHYQAVFIGWTGSQDPDGTLYPMFTSKGGFNYTKEAIPQVDTLLEDGRTSIDQTKRIADYQQAQQLIVNNAGRVFITHQVAIQATTSNVKNYFLSPSQVVDFTSTYLGS